METTLMSDFSSSVKDFKERSVLTRPSKAIEKFSDDFKKSSAVDAVIEGYWKVF